MRRLIMVEVLLLMSWVAVLMWLIAKQPTDIPSQYNMIMQSTDGGKTWVPYADIDRISNDGKHMIVTPK